LLPLLNLQTLQLLLRIPKTLFEVLARNEAQKWQATMEKKKIFKEK
jgi:hypothetical protein